MNSDIIIVSGLPRSGTSMMMAMLQAGGMPLLTDAVRAPDEDNPKGYYEYEPVRRLLKDAGWMDKARGKVVKVIGYLLPALPERFNYRVVYMERPIGEILASQAALLRHAGKPHDPNNDAVLGRALLKTEADARAWIAGKTNVTVQFTAYHQVLQHPAGCCESLEKFLGRTLNLDEMAKVVDEGLYRQRGGKGTQQ